jgi:hypothetical protein
VGPEGVASETRASELDRFHSVQVVERAAVDTIAAANAAGVRRARAPVVALCEDDEWAERGWVVALLRAHREPYAAVGPAVVNANPASAVSAADFLIGYGPWAEPVARQEVEHLPGHNSSYKRDVLLADDDRLEAGLAAETVLHWDLRRRGLRLLLEPGARVAHLNFSRWAVFLRVQLLAGRVFAAQRAASYSPARRAAFALAAPLIPAVRVVRLAASSPARVFLRALPALLPGLALDGLGQLLGYAAGPGRAPSALAAYEFHRVRHVRPGEAPTEDGS